jgi:ribosomal protein S18 acetylase RimI-like enzyme
VNSTLAGDPNIQLVALNRCEPTKCQRDAVARLIYDTAPFAFDLMFGNIQTAVDSISRWGSRKSSVYSLDRCSVLMTNGDVVGMFLHGASRVFVAGRRADALELLLRNTIEARRDAVLSILECFRNPAPLETDSYYLCAIAVRPDFQGRGLGRRMMKAFLRAGSSGEYNKFQLEVADTNTIAARLYESVGFREFWKAAYPAGGPLLRGMRMQL